jgi:hypothetical protein
VNRLRQRAERLRLFFKKMVEGSLLCSIAGANGGYIVSRMRFKRATIKLKALYTLKNT